MIRSLAQPDAPTAPLLLRDHEAAAMLGVSVRALWRGVGDGTFPAPVRLPGRVTRWRASDLAAWVEGLTT